MTGLIMLKTSNKDYQGDMKFLNVLIWHTIVIIKYSLGVPLGFGIRKIVEKTKFKKEEEACLE